MRINKKILFGFVTNINENNEKINWETYRSENRSVALVMRQ
jgi:hypothetical protein